MASGEGTRLGVESLPVGGWSMLLLFCALDAIVYQHRESFRLLGRKRSGAMVAGGGHGVGVSWCLIVLRCIEY